MNTKVLADINSSAKSLIKKSGPSINTRFPSLKETVNSILSASTPARKAHATRKLTSYAVNHAKKINSTPTRVIAGVCAVVTKHMRKNPILVSKPKYNKVARTTIHEQEDHVLYLRGDHCKSYTVKELANKIQNIQFEMMIMQNKLELLQKSTLQLQN